MKLLKGASTVFFALCLVFSIVLNTHANEQTKSKPSILEVISSGTTALISYIPLFYSCHPRHFRDVHNLAIDEVEGLPLFGPGIFSDQERKFGCAALGLYNAAQTVPFVCNLCNYYEGDCPGC